MLRKIFDVVEFVAMVAGVFGLFAKSFAPDKSPTKIVADWAVPIGSIAFISRHLRTVKEMKDDLSALRSELENGAKILKPVFEFGRFQVKENDAIWKSAIQRVFQKSCDSLPSLSDFLLALGSKKPSLLSELALIDTFLIELATRLPKGGLWAGISHLNDPDVWEHSTDTFNTFKESLRGRAANDEITVMRLYCFSREESLKKMLPVLKEDSGRKLNVRTHTGAVPPPDLTVLYLPTGAEPMSLEETGMRGGVPVLALRFSVGQNRQLKSLEAFTADEAQSTAVEFEQAWRKAKTFEGS